VTVQSSGANGGRGTIGLLLLLAAATALRIANLATLPFEQDELYTLRDARDLGATAGAAPGIAGRPLYYLLQHVLLEVLPPTPFLLRLPALAFGIIGLWMLYELTRRTFSTRAGLAAAAIAAFSPWHLYMSQFARYWSLIFLWAAAAYLALPAAMDSDRRKDYWLAFGIVVGGLLTHPTFAFPLVGFVLALHLVDAEGRIRFRMPTRNAWLALWTPLLAFVAGSFLLLRVMGEQDSLQNWGGRGLAATLRLVPSIVQWADPAVVATAGLGMLLLLSTNAHRRFGLAALAGTGSATALLLAASFRTDVYADYATAALPLLFVSAAGALDLVDRAASTRSGTVVLGGTIILIVAMLPGTVSHLIDGTRFDYAAAYEYAEATDPDALVVGGPSILARHYGPGLRTRETPDVDTLARWAREEESGLLLIAPYRRLGLLSPDPALEPWIDRNCRTLERFGRTRLDFRSYRLEVNRCTVPSHDAAAQASSEGGRSGRS
jgi:hypothetical protein